MLGLIDWSLIRDFEFRIITYCILLLFYYYLSSLYLCVFGNDHVTRYIGAKVDVGEHVDA